MRRHFKFRKSFRAMNFQHYEALGNYYLLAPLNSICSVESIRQICEIWRSDGVLFGSKNGDHYGLRIFNSDGSEAEKSGNGVRIFARYLWEFGHCKSDSCGIQTLGGEVFCQWIGIDGDGKINDFAAILENVHSGKFSNDSWIIRADLGTYSHGKSLRSLSVDGQKFRGLSIDIGNPHFVLEISDENSAFLSKNPQFSRENCGENFDFLNALGAKIERHEQFPRGTNVEFVKILRDNCISLHIWERGVGFTLSSGTCACAAAIYAHHYRHLPAEILLTTARGELRVELENFHGHIQGPISLRK